MNQKVVRSTLFLLITPLLAFSIWYSFFLADENADLASKIKLNNKRPLEASQVSQSNSSLNDDRVILNDPGLSQAWGINKSDAARAWTISQGNKNLVVAVIDTGCDVNHEDLKKNLWINPGESGKDGFGRDKAINGLDDDVNGYVDDVNGWNFVSQNNNLTDNHGHGTHIAGIIGAEAGNKKGIAGIAPQVSLMILKYYDPKVPQTDNLKNTIQAIQYVVRMKKKFSDQFKGVIINYSGGGTEFSADEKSAIEEARKNEILFVAAAGNERSNSDQFKYYPADYGLSNIVSVTAIDPSAEVLPSSNYGTETVDLAAPGQNIVSTLPNGSYGTMTGTSQATAFVTGGAVLVMAHKSIQNPEEIKKYLIATGDSTRSLLAKTKTSRQLNLYKSLTMLDRGVTVSGISASKNSDGDVTLTGVSDGQPGNESIDPARDIATFGKTLMNAISGTGGKKRVGTQQK